MSLKPKIYGDDAVKVLKESYLDKKMSTTEISKSSVELFGIFVGASTIYKELIRNKIPFRTISESVSRGRSFLNIDESYINEEIIEWVDGFLLGDGYLNFSRKRKDYIGSRFAISSIQKDFVDFAMSKFSPYGYKPECTQIAGDRIDKRHPNPIWHNKTLTHPDIVRQAGRWYSGVNQSKVVPPDIRITPSSLLLWYLGDGSLTYIEDCNTYVVRFATCAFSINEVENILMPKLTALGLECSRDKSKNDIRILASSIGRFFDFIGHKSPISCYDHKFAIPEWLRLIRLSDIVDNDKQKWMAQYYYKTGQIECSKSPGGKMLLFTKEQAVKLKNKLTVDITT